MNLIFFAFVICTSAIFAQEGAIPATYGFTLQHGWLTMKDGIKLAVDYYLPVPKNKGEKFPLVLEVLPYRKDDSFSGRDYPIYSYWAERGIAGARIDIRGTGGSEGMVGDREYSDQELADIFEIINQLAHVDWCNGNIGMMGKSWSAINGMATAIARPEHLKALIFMHGATDLYAMDIHGWDGALHIDMFSLEADIENIMPQTPDYPIDEAYFKNRFDVKPWIFIYLKHQKDSSWWGKNRSLVSDYKALNIPVYAIGGLLDGYRDSIPQILQNTHVPVRAEMNTNNHSFPFNGAPGPAYEWRQLATKWWLYWLAGEKTGIMDEPLHSVFMRDYVPANSQLTITPGEWWSVDKIPKTDVWTLFLGLHNTLKAKSEKSGIVKFDQHPGMADGTLNWWGERTGDMRNLDKRCVVFDSEPIHEMKHLLGIPKLILNTSVDSSLLDWIVRLEDVAPDGSVSLITGGLLQSSQYRSRLKPQEFPVNKFTQIEIPLHYTTWTFLPGHRVRVAISMVEFPLVWPTPYLTTMHLVIGDLTGSRIQLPIGVKTNVKTMTMPKPEGIFQKPGVNWIYDLELTPFKVTHDPVRKIDMAEAEEASTWEVDGRKYKRLNQIIYTIDIENPAIAAFSGEGNYYVSIGDRKIHAQSFISVVSDKNNFTTSVQRRLYLNSVLLRDKKWTEVIPRDFQ